MADHVAAVCRSCYYQLRQLRSVARSLSAEAVKAVAFRPAWTTVILYWLAWTKGSYGDYSPCRTPLHA